MNIGFFYIPYYPLVPGASAHGFQLASCLRARGHSILSCLGDQNPDCIHFDRTRKGAIRLAMQADVLYIRIATASFLERATLLKLIRPFSLPVVWEVNAPVEEVRASFPGGERDGFIHRESRRRRRFARLVDAGIGVSDVLQDYIKNDLGIQKAYAIANGSDPRLFDQKNARQTALDHLQDKFKVCWMGSTRTPWQGVEMILELAKRMEHVDPDIVFILMTRESLWEFPVLKNLLVLRQVPYFDFPHYLAAADVCLCLYKEYEWTQYGFYGSSLKLFDYMAAAKPIIASDMGQISDVIKDGINGLLVNNDIDTIIDKIRELKDKPDMRMLLGNNARQDTITFYNWDRVAEQTEAVLHEVCTSRAG